MKDQVGFNLTVENLSYTVINKQTSLSRPLLSRISGKIKSNELCCLLGPSGAGKSTFLDIIGGWKATGDGIETGTIRLDGQVVDREERRYLIEYISQEDTLLSSLTVKETLYYEVSLRQQVSEQKKWKMVNDLLETMNLKKAENTLVGTADRSVAGISGGERKRLSIALGLVSAPRLLLLDEPTSGLSAQDAFQLMTHLRELAARGHTILVSLHSPRMEVFELMNSVILLSRGRVKFWGKRTDIAPFFAEQGFECPPHYNLADFVLNTIKYEDNGLKRKSYSADKRGSTILPSSSTSPMLGTSLNIEIPTLDEIEISSGPIEVNKRRASYSSQLRIMISRSMRYALRNYGTYLVYLGTMIFSSIFFGLLYLRMDKTAADAATLVSAAYISLLTIPHGVTGNTVDSVYEFKEVFKRDQRKSLYHWSSYLIANVLIMVLRSLTILFVYSTILYWMIGFNSDWVVFVRFWLHTVYYSFFYELILNTLVGFLVQKTQCIAIISTGIAISNLGAGYWIKRRNMPFWLQWINTISPARYAFQLNAIVTLSGQPFKCDDSAFFINSLQFVTNPNEIIERVAQGNCEIDGDILLRSYGMEPDQIQYDIIAIFILLGSALILYMISLQRSTIDNIKSNISLHLSKLKRIILFYRDAQKDEEELSTMKVIGTSSSAGFDTIISKQRSVSLDVIDLSYTIGDTNGDGKKKIIQDVNFRVEPGELVALIGPSGSGKTTLLDLICGRKKDGDINGSILFNGKPLSRKLLKSHTAYVAQYEPILESITVFEALMFEANLMLPSNMSSSDKKSVVVDALMKTDLWGVRNSIVGSQTSTSQHISGGERKRLSVASKLLYAPDVLILDEPTTGLSSYDSFELVSHLKSLAKLGNTVICTIHQPSSEVFNLFDRVILMNNGTSILSSEVKELPSFLHKIGLKCPKYYNIANYIIDLLYVDSTDKQTNILPSKTESRIKKRLKKHEYSSIDKYILSFYKIERPESLNVSKGLELSVEEIPPIESNKAPMYAQFWYLTKRKYLYYQRTSFIAVFFFGALIQNATLSILFFQLDKTTDQMIDRLALIYYMTEFYIFWIASLLAPSIEFLKLFQWEYKNGMYNPLPFALSLLFISTFVTIATGIVTLTLTYFMIGLTPSFQSYFFTLAASATNYLSFVALAMSIVPFSGSYALAASLFVGFSSILDWGGGFFIPVKDIKPWLRWTSYLSTQRYIFSSVAIEQLENFTFDCVDANQAIGCPISGRKILEDWGIDVEWKYGYYYISIGFVIFFWILTYLFFKLHVKRNLSI